MTSDQADQNPSRGTIYPQGFLAQARPAGFESGKRLIAECPEFRLWELYRPGGPEVLERSPLVEEAFQKARFGIYKAGNHVRRIELALALECLARMARRLEQGDDIEGCRQVCEVLARTLGREIADVADGCKTSDPLNLIKSSLAAVSQERPTEEMPTEFLLISAASFLFAASRIRPTQAALKEALKAAFGREYLGKNSAKTWAEKFSLAGLEALPEK